MAKVVKKNYNKMIRGWLRKLIKDGVIDKESQYDSKGVYIKWNDGEVSATLDTGKEGYYWLKSHIIGDE